MIRPTSLFLFVISVRAAFDELLAVPEWRSLDFGFPPPQTNWYSPIVKPGAPLSIKLLNKGATTWRGEVYFTWQELIEPSEKGAPARSSAPSSKQRVPRPAPRGGRK